MTKWIKIKNNTKIDFVKIPILTIEQLRIEIIDLKFRPIAFFGKDWGFGNVRLFVALADDENADIYLSSTVFNADTKS